MEKLLFDLREKNVPVYLTKFRIKKPESIFLKLKRKPQLGPYKNFKDIAAIRVLTLFEYDLFEVCMAIMAALAGKKGEWNKYKVTKAQAYNFPIEKRRELRGIFNNTCKSVIFDPDVFEIKKSGYKSIHLDFVFGDGTHTVSIEMQLRTILQNVWGEIEHSLSYKQGDIHPHLKRSFQLLADDLGNADQLLNHLKDISTDDNISKIIGQDSFTPNGYFDYQDDVKLTFTGKPKLAKAFKEYGALTQQLLIAKKPGQSESLTVVNELFKKFEILRVPVDKHGYKKVEYQYWVNMEDAFYKSWLCGEKGKQEAFKIYSKMIDDHGEKYFVPYYRRGELFLSKVEDTVFEALNDFDMCERILAANNHNNINTYLVLGFLASAYSALGKEYIDLAIVKANEAIAIYKKKAKNRFFTEKRIFQIYNNTCWLYLLKYDYVLESDKLRGEKEKEANIIWKQVQSYFTKLLPALAKYPQNSHYFDTIAWCYFRMYSRDHSKANLNMAIKYIRANFERKNTSTFMHLSRKIQMFHYQQIMKEAEKVKRYESEK